MKPKTYFLKTYGCQMNEADSERIAGWLGAIGFKPAKKINEADWVIINTCSVRQSAEDRVFGLIKNLTDTRYVIRDTKRRIIVTGCILYHPIADLRKKLPEVDWFVKTKEWPKFLEERCKGAKVQRSKAEPKREDKTHAWVPIMEGCSHYCTYCVVPYARGKERSRPFEEIICRSKKLAQRGCKEITLLGQNVNAYGKDFKKSKVKSQKSKLQLKTKKFKKFKMPFALLLAVLHEIPNLEKISFITSNPWDLSDDIIEAMKLPKIDRYLHLPVQSGDDEILKKMNRPYTAAQYLKLVKKIRKRIPDIKIGTDLIVGFPGETKKAFENTVKLCRKVGFTKAYIAMYSPRPGTAAYRFADNVSYKEKKRRWTVLEELINRA